MPGSLIDFQEKETKKQSSVSFHFSTSRCTSLIPQKKSFQWPKLFQLDNKTEIVSNEKVSLSELIVCDTLVRCFF